MGRALLAALLIVAAGPAKADFVEGQARYAHEDFAGARQAWESAAEHGDARAQYGLGVLHWRGQGVAPDAKEAARWFARAARQGYEPALSALSALAGELDGAQDPRRRSGYGI